MKHLFVIEDHALERLPDGLVFRLKSTADVILSVNNDPDDPNANIHKNRYGKNGFVRKDQILHVITKDSY